MMMIKASGGRWKSSRYLSMGGQLVASIIRHSSITTPCVSRALYDSIKKSSSTTEGKRQIGFNLNYGLNHAWNLISSSAHDNVKVVRTLHAERAAVAGSFKFLGTATSSK
jgi:hypothetical protein